MIAAVIVVGGILAVSSLALFLFGANLLYLSWRSLGTAAVEPPAVTPGAEPVVCVQVPIYNERYVAERVIDAVARLDWPPDRLEVQALDDSDDATVDIVAAAVQRWAAQGLRISHVRRPTRTGYKAGALAHGLELTAAPLIAIFDADFVPPPDFLRRLVGAFADERVGFVQARWGHLNESYSWFTRLQALAIDFHFLVEQAVRSGSDWFTNFTGTAGLWRRAAIVAAGGWSARTLTEDLDLSYRAQLAGWRPVFVESVVVPEELPVSIDAYRSQQARWATGSFQSAFRLLPQVVRSPASGGAKVQAFAHLLAYGVGPAMLLQLACYPMLLAGRVFGPHWLVAATPPAWVSLISLAPWLGFLVAQSRRGRGWPAGLPAIACQLIGAAMSLTVLFAFVSATRPGGEFVRTPKHRIVRAGQNWQDKDYVVVGDPRLLAELAIGCAALILVPAGLALGAPLVAIYSAMFAAGFLGIGLVSAYQAAQVIAFRGLGIGALRALQAAAPMLGLLAIASALLLGFTHLPEPFEDSYQHWLMAAYFASTGHLRDPIFSMQDTWLPGYQVVAAAVLKAFGLWRLDLLKLLNAVFGLATLVCVARLAPNRRQARIAVLLLALNPIFLLVSTDVVAEPLLTLLLTGAALAGVKGRTPQAAALLAGACLVGTKAWVWVGALALVSLWAHLGPRWDRSRSRSWSAGGLGRFAWVPALALAAALQLGFAPATHSAARAAQEVASATARGSVSAQPLSRLWELLSTFGLATLPLAALALPGLVVIRSDRLRLRWLHVPALAYLAVVVVLVTSGTYTGSHRYLYLALPSLALLAAALLDRAPAPAWMLSALAAAALCVGFLPVFQGFAAANRGLEAAGKAASTIPGRLLTDSPTVAYFSHKAPDRIAGSMTLPADRSAALAYLRSRGYTSLVLEDISYYPAVSIFQDLAAGRPGTGFVNLGDQGSYRAAGGKPVFAYRVLETRWTAPLWGDVRLAVSPQPAEGKSAPLAKGAYLMEAGQSLAGEGMGFGVPIVHFQDGWWYPGTATTTDLAGGGVTAWRRVYELDLAGGDAAHHYAFVRTASRGEIAVTYTLGQQGVDVSVQVLSLAPGVQQVGVLNEESATFNDFADQQKTLLNAGFAQWVPVGGTWARLRSGAAGVEWSLPTLPGSELHGGRELATDRNGNLDWAGLDYVFGPQFRSVDYRIQIQEAR